MDKRSLGRIEFQCPDCGKKLSASEDKAGKVGRCPNCEALLRVRSDRGAQVGLNQGLDSAIANEVLIEMEAASRGHRLLGWIIDWGAMSVLAFVVGLACSLSGIDVAPMSSLYGFVVLFCYYAVLEGNFGQTLGKALLQMKVVDAQGETAEPSTVLSRTLFRLVPFEAITIFGKSRRTLHDTWSSTRVVQVAPLSTRRSVLVLLMVLLSVFVTGALQGIFPTDDAHVILGTLAGIGTILWLSFWLYTAHGWLGSWVRRRHTTRRALRRTQLESGALTPAQIVRGRQRRAIIVGAVVIAVMLLFPPWVYVRRDGNVKLRDRMGYRLLIAPPTTDLRHAHNGGWAGGRTFGGTEIDFGRLTLQVLLVLVITGGCVWWLHKPTSLAPKTEQPQLS